MGISKRTLIQKICDMAKLENTDLKGDKSNGHYIGKEWAKISENRSFQPFFHKHIVSLSEQPVSLLKMANFDPDIRTTGGFFTIKYLPKNDKQRIPNRPYQIGQDICRGRIFVSGPKHWHILASKIPELKWLDRNGTLTDYMFRIAHNHPGMSFYFTVDWEKYDKLIRQKSEAAGIDIDNKPFVTYRTTEEELAVFNTTYLLAPQRDLRVEYKSEVEELSHMPEENI